MQKLQITSHVSHGAPGPTPSPHPCSGAGPYPGGSPKKTKRSIPAAPSEAPALHWACESHWRVISVHMRIPGGTDVVLLSSIHARSTVLWCLQGYRKSNTGYRLHAKNVCAQWSGCMHWSDLCKCLNYQQLCSALLLLFCSSAVLLLHKVSFVST